jgi:hypothetical protein
MATAASSAAICAAELVGSRETTEGVETGASSASDATVCGSGGRRLGRRVTAANTASIAIASAANTSRIVQGKPEGRWTAGWGAGLVWVGAGLVLVGAGCGWAGAGLCVAFGFGVVVGRGAGCRRDLGFGLASARSVAAEAIPLAAR